MAPQSSWTSPPAPRPEGKIIVAEQLGTSIPPGWAVDAEGRPTDGCGRGLAGAVLPFAGPKGSGLAMMIDLLCGGLLAGVSGFDIGDMYETWDRPQRVTHLFVVLDPDRWIGRTAFADHVRRFAAGVHALPAAAGVEQVLLPGEVEEAAAEPGGARGRPAARAGGGRPRRVGERARCPSALVVTDP